MGKRALMPSIPAWCRRALAPIAGALRRARPGPPAFALFAAEALTVLFLVALLVKPFGGGGREPAAVVQPSARPAATPSHTPPAVPLAEANEAARPVFDPAAVFGNLPPPMVEETFDVTPFDSPRLDGGIYHLSAEGTQLVRIKSETRAPRTFEHEDESAVSPDGRWLAFASIIPPPAYTTLPSKVVVYIKDLATHEPARPVANVGEVMDLVLSPGGQKLLLGGSIQSGVAHPLGRGLYLVDIPNQTVRELPQLDHARTIRWSPAGDHLLFQQSDVDSGKSALYLADGDGENVRRLLDDISGDAAWSPDGSQIAVADCCRHEGAHLVRLDGTTTSLRNVLPLDDQLVPSQFSWSPNGSRIAFHSREYSSDVLTLNAVDVNTGEIADLGPGEDPVWSHDGSRIAYLRDGKLYIALPDGREAWPVINPMQSFISSVAWSASDSGFVFNYETSPVHSIWTISLEGGSEQFLAHGDTPAWSPDGAMIAFIGKVRNARSSDDVVSDNEVWVMNSDGSFPHRVGEYRSFRSLLYGATREGCARNLAWSADSTEVIFGGPSERVAAPADGSAPAVETGVGCGPGPSPTGNGWITEPRPGDSGVVYDATGTELFRLPGAGAQWSPDGSLIAYWQTGRIHVVEYPAGAERLNTGNLAYDDYFPGSLWSPDGKFIAFPEHSRSHIYVASVDRPEAGFDLSPGSHPTWSPDSSQIAFSYTPPADGPGIFVTDPVYGAWKTRIADGLTPSWSPGGSLILFTR